jgi:geranylgeranyl pyrophosphate synthase/predicted secreted hydrolase
MTADGNVEYHSSPLQKKKSTDPSFTRSFPQSPSTGISFHYRSEIEWWFIHGTFEGKRSGSRHFMVSLFRFDPDQQGKGGSDGYYLLVSLLDPATGFNAVASRGETSVISRVFGREGTGINSNLDQRLIEVYTNELHSCGPPAPVILVDEHPQLVERPFSVTWNDFSIAENDGQITLTFDDPVNKTPCRLFLHPLSDRYSLRIDAAPINQLIDYVTIPNLEMTGTFGTEPVMGTAWMDHQWGNSGFFLSRPRGGRVYGWDWAGINGNDGSDWIFHIFRDMQSGEALDQFAIHFERGKKPCLFREFAAKPLRFWESEKTHICYPVSWTITFPKFSGEITIEPVTDDQEIPVLGFMRAVWEGAAKASGCIGGHTFTGRARLELHGYGYIFDFEQYLQHHAGRIHDSIESFFPKEISNDRYQDFVGIPYWHHETAACNKTIADPIWDLLSRKKKYWRPLFGILLLEALGVSSEKYRMLLTVIPELTHTGTLIIDDIEDNASLRRGDACIHLSYGLDVAINAANTLYFLPATLYARHPDLTDQQRLELYKITHDTFTKGHFGQALDIYWTKNLTEKNITDWSRDHLKEKILQMYDFKTASAAIVTAEACCILAGANTETRAACSSFSRVLGVSFQIINDLDGLDADSEAKEFRGDDIRSGKLTYVMVRSLELLELKDKNRLKKILCSKRLRQNEKTLQEAVHLMKKSGVAKVCRKEAGLMVENEWQNLSKVLPASEARTMLRLFSEILIQSSGSSVSQYQ